MDIHRGKHKQYFLLGGTEEQLVQWYEDREFGVGKWVAGFLEKRSWKSFRTNYELITSISKHL